MGASSNALGYLLIFLCALTVVNSYSKYGRGCADIGCLPNEMCVMAHESCSFGQRDGKECGSYPTCRKGGAGGQANSGGASLNPAPDNTRLSSSSNPSSPSSHASNSYNNHNSPPINPNYVFGSPNQQTPYGGNVPIFPYQQPTQQPPFQQFPQPQNPQYPQYPQYPAYVPRNPSNPYSPNSPPIIFGNPPAYYNPQPTTREPSLLHQFLYNKQGGRRNSSGRIISSVSLATVLASIAIILHHMT
ncbi:unnamed protein product [Hermetia illucens]|uniref:Uncharacterized protein n=1 Tax=Hermetia illucens TaxID=343691 RepID=A0A7R8YZ44_HERIL|nr:unnamed protein product [Hermetia illucens]